jgi:hypothetical protein
MQIKTVLTSNRQDEDCGHDTRQADTSEGLNVVRHILTRRTLLSGDPFSRQFRTAEMTVGSNAFYVISEYLTAFIIDPMRTTLPMVGRSAM